MEESGVDSGDIGGNKDWKTVVTRDSKCLGIAEFAPLSCGEVAKLFMTSNGAARCSCPPPRGCFINFRMSLQREYLLTRK